jgi:hypothetical protein
MMNYRKLNVYIPRIAYLTAEQLAHIQDEVTEINEANRLVYETALEQLSVIRNAALKIWPRFSKEYKAIEKLKVPQPPDVLMEFAKLNKRFETYQKKKANQEKQQQELNEKRRKKAEYQRTYYHRQKEAIKKLEAMGYILGQDFWQRNAISFLKDVKSIPEAPFPMTEGKMNS